MGDHAGMTTRRAFLAGGLAAGLNMAAAPITDAARLIGLTCR